MLKKYCITIYTGQSLTKYIKSKFVPNIAFVLPSTNISGGVLVALKHLRFLKKAGYDAFIINEDRKQGYLAFETRWRIASTASMHDTVFEGTIDKRRGDYVGNCKIFI